MSLAVANRTDWSSPTALHAAWDTLDDGQQRRLKSVWRKPKANSRLRRAFGRAKHRYASQSGIYAMANWSHADVFCDCGFRDGNRIISCGHWRFCCSCSYQRKWNALCQYAPHFGAAQWHFVTISFAGGIEAEDLLYWPLRRFWDVCRDAVTLLQRTNHIQGGLLREELQVMSLLPLRLRPHLHLLATAPSLTAEAIEAVMREKLGTRLDDLPAPLDVDCRATQTERAFFNRLSYMHKELDLLTPYRAAIKRLGTNGDFTMLNGHVGAFLRHFTTATHRRRQTGATGALHPLSPGYLGTRPDLFRRSSGEDDTTRDARNRYFDHIGRLVRSHCHREDES